MFDRYVKNKKKSEDLKTKNKKEERYFISKISVFFAVLLSVVSLVGYFLVFSQMNEFADLLQKEILNTDTISIYTKEIFEGKITSYQIIDEAQYTLEIKDFNKETISKLMTEKINIYLAFGALFFTKLILSFSWFFYLSKKTTEINVKEDDNDFSILFILVSLIYFIFSFFIIVCFLFSFESLLSNTEFLIEFLYAASFFSSLLILGNLFFFFIVEEKAETKKENIINNKKKEISLEEHNNILFKKICNNNEELEKIAEKASKDEYTKSEIEIADDIFLHIKQKKENKVNAKERGDKYKNIINHTKKEQENVKEQDHVKMTTN